MFAHAITVHHKLKVITLKSMYSIDPWMEKRWKYHSALIYSRQNALLIKSLGSVIF